MRTKVISAIVIIVIVIVAVGGFTYYQYVLTRPKELQPVKISVGFIILGRFAPLYVALNKGYYEQEGLKATILPAGGQPDAIQKLEAGTFDAVYCDVFSAAQAIAAGAHIKYVMTLYAVTPLVMYASPSITTPKDLVGKTIAESGPGDIAYVLLPLFANKAGIDYNTLHVVTVEPSAKVPVFISGKADAMATFAFSTPQIKTAMPNVNMFSWEKYGIEDPTGLCVRDDMIKDKPKVVQGIIRATTKGFYDALNNPDEAADIFTKDNPAQKKPVVLGELGVLRELMVSPSFISHGIGWIDTTQADTAVNIANHYGGYHQTLSSNQVYTAELFPGKLGNLTP